MSTSSNCSIHHALEKVNFAVMDVVRIKALIISLSFNLKGSLEYITLIENNCRISSCLKHKTKWINFKYHYLKVDSLVQRICNSTVETLGLRFKTKIYLIRQFKSKKFGHSQ